MTLILTIATLALLTFLGLSCRRARLDFEEQVCQCASAPVAAAAGFGRSPVELAALPPVLIARDGGGAPSRAAGRRGRRAHLQVVEGR